MEHDPRQSIHEVGLATQMAVRPGKPMLVTVRSASALVPRSRPNGEDGEDIVVGYRPEDVEPAAEGVFGSLP
jgi:RecA/RadA recombinase